MAFQTKGSIRWAGQIVNGDVGPITCYRSKWKRLVWFDRAPPKEPPSEKQLQQRALWTIVAQDWKTQTPEQKATWERITITLSLPMTGYNLFLSAETNERTREVLPTLGRQSGETVPPFTIRAYQGK